MNKTATTIALVMFGIFIIVVYLGLEDIARRSGFSGSTRTVTTQSPCNLSVVSSFIYGVYAELNHTNSILTEVYSRQHPQLKKNLLFWDFQKHVAMYKSKNALPGLRFRPLKEVFKDDYDDLVKRYRKEYPRDTYRFEEGAAEPESAPKKDEKAPAKKGYRPQGQAAPPSLREP